MRALDRTELRLLLALTDDPRATTVALAQKLGVTRNTVQARMASLEAAGVLLPYDRCINEHAIGRPLTAFTTVFATQQKLSHIAAELAQIPEVVQAFGMTGPTDLLVRIVCVDTDELFRINERILACEGVERTETSIAINELVPYRLAPLLRQAELELDRG
ncbi:MAG: Lrp/AsnC family transcriptional regulator [Pseudolysinimonas sp.]